MKQSEVKPLMLQAWDVWAAKRGLDPANATGRDALRFYYELKDAKSPLAAYLIDLPAFDPAHPDLPASFVIPAEPAVKAETPYGK